MADRGLRTPERAGVRSESKRETPALRATSGRVPLASRALARGSGPRLMALMPGVDLKVWDDRADR
jgi:hypothetical protein